MLEYAKKILWKILEPVWPSLRDLWIWLRLVRQPGRQPYLYGILKPGVTQQQLRQLLKQNGFTNNYLAWVDPDETLNMYKVVNTIWQYHVRLFINDEVRAHHEFTTESHPFKHLYDVGLTSGESYLRPLLAPLLEPHPPNNASNKPGNPGGETPQHRPPAYGLGV